MALVGLPLVLAIAYSLSDVTVGDQSIDFVGLRNFRDALKTPLPHRAQNTFVFTIVSQAVVLVLANILALVLSADFQGKRFVRFLVLLPWTTPIALGAIGWLMHRTRFYSPIDWLLGPRGLLGPDPARPANNMYWLGRLNLAPRRSSSSTSGGCCRWRR